MRKYSVVFLKHFPKKMVFGGSYLTLSSKKSFMSGTQIDIQAIGEIQLHANQ